MNHFFTLLFAASCFTAFGQVQEYWPADGIIYWFDFESDGSSTGFEYAITTGTVNAAEDRFGLPGAAQFANGEDILIATGDSQAPSETFSYSFWFYTSPGNPTTTALHPIHGQTFGDEEDHSGSGVLVGSSQLAVIEHSSAYVREAIRVDLDLSGWHHVVVSYANNGATLYLDGELQGVSVSDGRVVHPPLGACDYYGSWGFGEGYGNPSGQYGVTVEWTDYRFLGRLDDFGVWERALLQEEVVSLFNASGPIWGCTNVEACNYNESAHQDDGSCHFLCEYCIDGTIWNEELQGCVHGQSADINNDGCVQLNDLLDVLSAYGDCGTEEAPWACGDPLSYQGYDYATVQIGDQCWFAENLQANLYTSGDSIPGDLSNDSWAATTEGARCAYNEDNVLIAEYGQLYNLHAVLDARGLCPVGWHVPSASDFDPLAQSLGGSSVAGLAMKSSPTDSPSWNGTNTSGFNGLPGGYRDMFGMFNMLGVDGHWWTSTEYICGGRDKKLHTDYQFLNTHHGCLNHGNSVRCLKDPE
ncbi:MAG: FISUMP domain-containing protein [Bacteroidetes bacterium]|nr:FISUMP domain-containing protein [Bacteroidota bacterium]